MEGVYTHDAEAPVAESDDNGTPRTHFSGLPTIREQIELINSSAYRERVDKIVG
jgi:hypothetical protein